MASQVAGFFIISLEDLFEMLSRQDRKERVMVLDASGNKHPIERVSRDIHNGVVEIVTFDTITDEKDNEIERLKAELRKLDSDNDGVLEENACLEKKVKTLTEENAAYVEQVKRLEAEIAHLQ